MPEPLKNMYSPALFEHFGHILSRHIPGFDRDLFKQQIFDDQWDQRELKERMRHTSIVLHQFFPSSYDATLKLFRPILEDIAREKISKYGFELMCFPDYIEVYGIDDFEASVRAMQVVTTYASCEFAVRPYLIRYGKAMMEQMQLWSTHAHLMVRRLASEGMRPRLPWAMAVPALKKDPAPILPILENLKDDPSEIVRRSVANNINDISKDHPEVVLRLIKKWKANGNVMEKVLKHGARTLLRQGHPDAMTLFGYIHPGNIRVEHFGITYPVIQIGGDQYFSFDLINPLDTSVLIRLEYAVYFKRSRGKVSRKVFMISEKKYPPNSITTIRRKQHFRKISTRKYYPGQHAISIILNGHERARKVFEVIE